MQKILLLGSTGFIGSYFKEALPKAGFEVFDPRIEIRDYDEVEKAVRSLEPDVIINATGMTGRPNVDWCETHQEETFSVNVDGSLNIAKAAHQHGINMVQMSSGCVYEGDNEGKGFTEEDEPNFKGSVYSRSRIASEKALKEFTNVLQLRIRMPITSKPNPRNFIDKLVKYDQIINITNSCTVIEDFVPAAIELIKRGEVGIFNMTNIGAMDHKEIMGLYKKIVQPDFELNLMPQGEQDTLCMRRSNCILNTDKREGIGVHMPPLKESVERILEEYKKIN